MKEAYKHRLIGAGILAAVAVLFLPSFFKDKQQYTVDTASQIPQPPTITTVDFAEPVEPEAIVPAPAADAMFVPDETEAAASMPAASAQASSSAPAVSELPLNAAGLPDAWVIQVVSLSSKDAATKLRDQLQAEGHKAYIRAVTTANGQAHRIYIGPKLDKAEALSLKQSIDKRLKVNSLVLPFKPE